VRPSHWTLYSLIVLMTTLWAINFIVAKIALRELPPLLVIGIRSALAALAILPVYWWESRGRNGGRWTRQDLPVLIGLGLFGVALNQLFFVLGMSRTSVAHAALIIGLTPVLVLMIASAARLETLSAGRLLGMFTALAGVVLLQTGAGRGSGATLAGDAFIFLGAFTFALFTVGGKRVAHNFTSITLNTFAYAAAGLALAPVTLWKAASFPFENVSATAWASVAYMALVASVLCYLIYYHALTWIPASRVAAFSYVQPLLATVIAIPTLGERPTGALVAGGVLVLAGVIIAERF
jgi:drug/metabolite transporter (DMT)-like permease